MTKKVNDPDAAAKNMIEPIGLALWGSSWKASMAEALGVSRDTVSDWAFGRMHPRPGIYRDLLRVAQDRRNEISQTVTLIKTHIGDQLFYALAKAAGLLEVPESDSQE